MCGDSVSNWMEGHEEFGNRKEFLKVQWQQWIHNQTQSGSEVLLAALELAACNFRVTLLLSIQRTHFVLFRAGPGSATMNTAWKISQARVHTSLLPALDCSGFTPRKEIECLQKTKTTVPLLHSSACEHLTSVPLGYLTVNVSVGDAAWSS